MGFAIFDPDTSQVFGIVLGDEVPVQFNGLIADDDACPVHLGRVYGPAVHVAFGAGDKESYCMMNLKQASKVDVADVHYIKRVWLQDQNVQHIDLVHLAVANVNEGGIRAPEVQQGVRIDDCLGFVKRCRPDQAQAQNDGGGVNCVDCILEVEHKVLVQIKLASELDQYCRQVGPDSPVARLVSVGQSGAVNAVAKSDSVKIAQVSSKSHFDFSQAISPSQLFKIHDSKLLRDSQVAHVQVSAIARHDSRKACPWNELHDLGKQGLADIHRKPSRSFSLGKYTGIRRMISNRHSL